MDDFLEFIVVISCLFAAVIGLLFGGFCLYEYFISKPSCEQYGRISGNETDWTLGTSCIVKYNGQWVSYSVAAGSKQEITLKGNP